ncbi:MAG: tetratricopeptide repeat protein [Bacteroidales bacterium]|nr:tetratricopeptide repeat protein [Bacteroidales bacterium]
MNQFKNRFLFFVLTCLSLLVVASNEEERDSLLSVRDNGTPAQRTRAYLKLEQYYRNIQADSALMFAKKALEIAQKNKIDTLLVKVYNNLAISYKLQGNYDSTIYYFQKSLKMAIERNDTSAASSALNNLGIFYDDLGETAKALDFFIQSAELSEKLRDKDGMALSYNNIGLIHYKLEDYKRAKQYYEKALVIRQELQDTEKIALLYNNIGILYYYEDDPQTCLDYFKNAAHVWQKSNNKRQLALVFTNIGELYYELQIYQSAMNYLLESQKLYVGLKDAQGELYVLVLLGMVNEEWGKYDEAIKHYLKSIELAKTIDAKADILTASHALAQLYQNIGNYKASNTYYAMYVEFKDSLINEENNKTIQELQTRYETEKKEQEIELLNNKNKLSEAVINRQRIVNTSLIIGVILVLLLAFLFIRQNNIRKKNNQILLLKNAEITQQNEEITAQRDEIEAQRDMVHLQKEHIEHIHQQVSQSIDYAERIQNATLPNEQLLSEFFTQQFILFKPRDVVSGDFYWWGNDENTIVVAAGDSTGHGVPGAFMSMLGISLLKEIVIKEYIFHPGVILRRLRKEIINTLKQKGEIGEQKDGMDMALISFNKESNILQFAGANNPIYIIKKNHIEASTIDQDSDSLKKIQLALENETHYLYEIKPDKMPIAIYDKMDRFTTHEIKMEKGDRIYLFSDGFVDQFGGPKGKKFKALQFKKLILQTSDLSLEDQYQFVIQVFNDWRADAEQIDDILVVGIEV